MKKKPAKKATADDVILDLLRFFKNDVSKVASWLASENPMLGGITPIDMIVQGRTAKLAKFVRHQLEENNPPELDPMKVIEEALSGAKIKGDGFVIEIGEFQRKRR